MPPTLYYAGHSMQDAISIIPWFMYISYLSVFNRALFKSYFCYGLFLMFEKPFKYYENPSKVYHFQYDNRFLFSREIGNIRSRKEVRLQKHKFRLSEESVRFGIFQVA